VPKLPLDVPDDVTGIRLSYMQIVENKRDGAAVRQTVIAILGRVDELAASGALASLLASGAKLTDQVLLINGRRGRQWGAVGLG
jgi:hypothetical protein